VGYDIIGDIHGHARSLEALLEALGYACIDGTWRHPSRKAVFLGDFIDRGPQQRGVIRIVRPMIDAGHALAVMGNHEFNAIAYATPRAGGSFFREHNARNYQQHGVFLDAYEYTQDYHELIDWFGRLPLWLDLGDLRIVHACWDHVAIGRLAEIYDKSGSLSNSLLYASCTPGNWEFRALETLLKGKEIPLPRNASFTDKDGITRHHIRVRWWDRGATSYREAFLGTESMATAIPDDDIVGDHLVEYSHDDVPVFVGHYWLTGKPAPLAPNIACLDYSVAKPGGKLVAYRWDGERVLHAEKFVAVTAVEFALTEML
jgi:Calcineurin-like phosphoesterase